MNAVIRTPRFVPDGTPARPARTYYGDQNLGSYRVGEDNEGFAAGGGLLWDYSPVRIASTIPVVPTTNDAAALGSGLLSWSDLFLASGSIINFNNGDVTLTHSADALTLAGGQFLCPDGTVALPGSSWAADRDSGRFKANPDSESISVGAIERLRVQSDDGIVLRSGGILQWASGNIGSAIDLQLFRDAANILAQRNGANAQEYRIENTFTDAANREFVSLGFINNINVFTIQPEVIGAGTVRNIALMGGNVGVGTTNPGARLHVVGDIAVSTGSSINFDGALVAGAPTTYLRRLNANIVILETTLLSTDFIFNPSRDIFFRILGVDALTIKASRNIGIGTTTPDTFLLEVAGAIGPEATNTRDLGTAARRWRQLFAGTSGIDSTGVYTQTGATIDAVNASGAVRLGSPVITALSLSGANNRVQIGPGTVPVKVGIAATSVAAAPAEDGGVMIATVDDTLIYYSDGARYKLVGVSF